MASKIIDLETLVFWAEHKYNVMMIGKHGIGKTALVSEAFKKVYGEKNEGWLYFSAPTMDPWVDFIGIPREMTSEDGNKYIGLVRPEVFIKQNIKAIFIDEFNRAHKKVNNAIMELCQFKTINGVPIPGLEVVWAAINPDKNMLDEEDVTYKVEEMDDTWKDRFQVHVELPYDVSIEYFVSTYGDKVGNAAVEYWRGLPDTVQRNLSPRRLDYALQMQRDGGDLKYVLPKNSNTRKLLRLISQGSTIKAYKEILETNDNQALRKFLGDPNNWAAVKNKVATVESDFRLVLPCCKKEDIVAMVSNKDDVNVYPMVRYMCNNIVVFHDVVNAINKSSTTPTILNLCSIAISKYDSAKKNKAKGTSLGLANLLAPLPKASKETFDKSCGNIKYDISKISISNVNNNLTKVADPAMLNLEIQSLQAKVADASWFSSSTNRGNIVSELVKLASWDLNKMQALCVMEMLEAWCRRTQFTKVSSIIGLPWAINTLAKKIDSDKFTEDYQMITYKVIEPILRGTCKDKVIFSNDQPSTPIF
jgi:hypothetical protein